MDETGPFSDLQLRLHGHSIPVSDPVALDGATCAAANSCGTIATLLRLLQEMLLMLVFVVMLLCLLLSLLLLLCLKFIFSRHAGL